MEVSIPPAKDDAARHRARFIAMLDAAFKHYGIPSGLPPGLRKAVKATPRHRFVHRFRLGEGPLLDFDDDPDVHLATVYSDQVMRHVDARGAPLPSTNSQPSYVLWLLHMLDLRAGQRVLEIGSGSGWLVAIMAHLVGRKGHATGIEIIPALARRSRSDVARIGRRNVTIVAGDGTAGAPKAAPFDRVMITAATWGLPAALFDQVADGGYVLVPIEQRGTDTCQVTLLQRSGNHFVAQRSVIGWFVPLIGSDQDRTFIHRPLDSLPFAGDPAAGLRFRLPLGISPAAHAGPILKEFRSFLGRTEPGFAVFTGPGAVGPEPSTPFGLVDDTTNSAALIRSGELIGFGRPTAVRRLASAFAQWAAYGLPGMDAFQLEVWRTADAPVATGPRWKESRDGTTLLWSLPPDATAWRSLLDPGSAPEPA